MSDRVLPLDEALLLQGGFGDLRATCPHCGRSAVFPPGNNAGVQAPTTLEKKIAQALAYCFCPGCKELVLGVRISDAGKESLRLLWPRPIPPDKAPEGLDQQIRARYDEARRALTVTPTGAAVLARRCLQDVIRMKLGITKDDLFSEIQEAVKKNDLSTPTKAALDHVRVIGNWGAHPILSKTDPAHTIIEVTLGEAEYTLEVLEMLFEDLFTRPLQVAEMENRLKARK